MFYKCEGFVKQVDPGSDTYKKFKRVMDKRNNLIHGNVDPVKEQLETVYFEGTRPLFKDSGDHIGKMFEVLENQHKPQEILEDYENTYSFLLEIANCLNPTTKMFFWRIMEDGKPGYDVNRKKLGGLFPEHVVQAMLPNIKYDDELVDSK